MKFIKSIGFQSKSIVLYYSENLTVIDLILIFEKKYKNNCHSKTSTFSIFYSTSLQFSKFYSFIQNSNLFMHLVAQPSFLCLGSQSTLKNGDMLLQKNSCIVISSDQIKLS
jgi:hypothetical protein